MSGCSRNIVLENESSCEQESPGAMGPQGNDESIGN